MTADSPAARAEAVRARYRQVFATVPPGIEARLAVAEATGRLQAVETIEDLRRVLLAGNPLDDRRSRYPDHSAAPDGEPPDIAVFAWATGAAR